MSILEYIEELEKEEHNEQVSEDADLEAELLKSDNEEIEKPK